MLWKKRSLADCNLYLILDTQVCSYQRLFDIACEAVAAGVDIVQLRDKAGAPKDILHFSQKFLKAVKGKVPYIINDRIDVALAVGADGVHLGQEDLNLSLARKLLGSKALIGCSCQTLQHLSKAKKDKPDYIGFGSVFKTLTKPHRDSMSLNVLKKAVAALDLPFFAIGGITLKNIEILRSVGVRRFAVCRDICLAKNVTKTVSDFKRLIN